MGKITIEFDDKILSTAVVAALGAVATTTTISSSDNAVTAESIAALCKELGAKECRPILKEAGYSSPKALIADEDVEQEDLDDIYANLVALQSGDAEDEDEDEDEDGAEIDIETVKKAVQAFAKENGKEEADEILEEFEIKSVRSLKKLDQEQLEELYEAVTEE